MLNRILIGLVAAGAAVIGVPGVATADPEPAPPPPPPAPNVNAFAPISPADFATKDGQVYAFSIAGGVTCVISRGTGNYGCSGPIPGAPEGANVVTGAQQGAPQFATTARGLYPFEAPPKPLPAGSRIGYRNVACGTDGTMTVCNNSFDGAGFVISPAGSYVTDVSNPLLLNTGEGKNPYSN
ncbi:MAG: hypothetical protein QOJ80_5324 [Mycobacterium sp.]|nr:hypothetical protein [Mycobacterium sp.]